MTKEERKEYAKKYYLANKEIAKLRRKERYNEKKEEIFEKRKVYDKLDRVKEKRNIRLKNKRDIFRQNNPLPKKNKQTKTPEQLKEYRKQYYLANKEKFKGDKDKRNARVKERKATEPLFKIKTNIRSLINQSIKNKGYRKANKTEQILGCTYQQFKEHIEKQFESWMSWDNYGNPKDKIFEPNKTWDIDHIIPIDSAITEDDVIRLNHYSNLRPLCSYNNRFIKRAQI